MTFMALGPAGISIMVNHNMGLLGSQEVLAARTYTRATLILATVNYEALVERMATYAGQMMYLTTDTITTGVQFSFSIFSPRFSFLSACASLTPTTTTCSVTKS